MLAMRNILILALLLPGAALAQETITVFGCPMPGTEAGCMVLRTQDGKFYDLSGARSRPPINGRGLRITGRRSDPFSYCQQGQPLAEVTWEQTGVLCPGR